MTTRSYRQHWKKLVARDREYFVEKLSTTKLPDLSKAIFPEMEVDTYFSDGLLLSYANELSLAKRCLKLAVAISRHLVDTDRFRTKKSRKYFPINRGQALRLEAYSRLLLGQDIPIAILKQSSADFFDWLDEDSSLDSHEIAQERWLSCAVQNVLINNIEKAAEILASPRRFSHFRTCQRIFTEAISALENKSSSRTVPSNLMKIVDKYRGPSSDYPLLAFEALLLWNVVAAPGETKFDPAEIVRQLGR